MPSRHVTDESHDDPEERFRLYRLCDCPTCEGKGKGRSAYEQVESGSWKMLKRGRQDSRCPACSGEGRVRELIATCGSPEALGVAIVTLGREHEFDECPIGVLDTFGEKGERWLVRPWLPSARNVSDAGRVLGSARKKARPIG